MRRRVLLAFELAEREAYLTGVKRPLNFVVVGGGPTGVELAGAIADIARQALAQDFKAIDTTQSARHAVRRFRPRPRHLWPQIFPKARNAARIDWASRSDLNSFVTDIEPGRVKVGDKWIDCDVVLWATGVAASPLGKALGVEIDKAGRVFVEPDLTYPGARMSSSSATWHRSNRRTASRCPASARPQCRWARATADNILRDIKGEPRENFHYCDKGTMATIGRSKAIADIRGMKFQRLYRLDDVAFPSRFLPDRISQPLGRYVRVVLGVPDPRSGAPG